MTTVSGTAGDGTRSREVFTLVYAVFVAGLCSIIYELLIATTLAYFEGDSVTYFSLTIGLYMAAMGAGAYASKYLTGNLMLVLVAAETALGFLGGFSIPVLYWAFANTDAIVELYVALTLLVGFLIGLEVPLLTRLLERYDSLRVSIAHVLSLDYLGALIATVAFPLVLLPLFGTFRSGLFFGLMNMSIGLLLIWRFSDRIGRGAAALFRALSVLIALSILAGLVFAHHLLGMWNASVYEGRVLHAERTRFQQIVLARHRADLRLYLDGNLQFSSLDEYRYHELLVHVPMAALRSAGRTGLDVLMLGGGDGLAVRELLKHNIVERVTLVDLDPAVTRIGRENPHVTALNGNSLTADSRVRVVNADAFGFLRQDTRLYDLVLADLPDPNNTDLARLYTREFYRLVRNRLAPDGLFVTQSTSPVHARRAFWTIHDTLAAEFAHTYPYHALVPSFGDWGFVLAADRPVDVTGAAQSINVETRYLDAGVFPSLFRFEKDIGPPGGKTPAAISTLDQPVILRHYLDGWRQWER